MEDEDRTVPTDLTIDVPNETDGKLDTKLIVTILISTRVLYEIN